MNEKITNVARRLRKNQTKAEEILWNRLRNRRFLNQKFLRQHPIRFQIENSERFFVADFFCAKNKLVIEIDGGIHFRQKNHDQFRDLIIHELGFQIIRVTNKMIEENTDFFLSEIVTPLLFGREGAGG
jgi:very-short-patch-repair endonuclease